MNVSLQYLERCSGETGYQVGALEKVVRLGELAADVVRHPFLGSVLALKGGTALNLCFGPPRRLSVDLDFNYIGYVERERMLEDRPRVERAMTELARRRGYGVQQSAEAFAGRKLYLRYGSVVGHTERLEVDLNYIFRIPLAAAVKRIVWQPGELDRPEVRVVDLTELLIGKFLAFFDRVAVRDVWDVAYLSDQAADALLSPQFRPRFVAFSAILNHPLRTYGRDRIESRVTDHAIAAELAPMLAHVAPLSGDELVERAYKKVAEFVDLTPNEGAYHDAVQRGELRLELLFPHDAEEATRLRSHPALLWKVQNVREYLARKGKKRAKSRDDLTQH